MLSMTERSKGSRSPEKLQVVPRLKRYVYGPLKARQSVRFLVLQPGSECDPLIGSLEVGSLDLADIEQLLPYEAISYVWGNCDRHFELICDGDILTLTQSIHDALHRVRLPDQPRRLWADQVCINQEDGAERSQQVRLMNSVYKNAKNVLVWLGSDLDGVAEKAERTVRELNEAFKDTEAHAAFKLNYEENLATQSLKPWIPLAKLTKLPWVIWIVQEIGTTAPATLYWGDTEIDWEELSFVATVLNGQYYHFRTRFSINTSSISYLRRRFVEPDTAYYDRNKGHFAYELHKARPLLAGDNRDRIYAFLGHYSINKGGKELQNLTADYSKSLKDVYIDVAVRILRGAQDLVMLSSAHYDVPDWRYLPLHILGSPSVPHRASKDTKPDLTIDEDARILHIRGVRVDVLTTTSWQIRKTAFQIRQGAQETKERKGDWGNNLQREELDDTSANKPPTSRISATSSALPYDHRQSAFFAFIQTLTNGCVSFDRSRPYSTISSEEFLAGGAAYLTRYAQPPSSSASRPASSSSVTIQSQSQTFSPLSSISHDRDRGDSTVRVNENGNASPVTTNFLSSHSELVSPDIHALSCNGDPFKWSREAVMVTRHRRFAVARKGYFVLRPGRLQENDVVVVLRGGTVPFLLRRGGWVLVGECYVHGLMDGEKWETEGVEEEVFSIR
ncbi:hypothetical protein M431DRAFT_514531 [Trichoderma harzianum CBS 226.95]|uniref:Heterokaryon incompatibility domain-containing protein n=1 Tax=Trichoderma harzianum CBS 226.95 TaxID=983964 RepID=A0A2T4ASF9_TRIHA|nr:hypothetical protein M431DRAFT_514531 [Trichoderma harzianum CBS 226.95]PTB60002.1 hypothetical protein M431DRAFT_514531 [Trichoderma harzianum CBS 226.95]